MGGAEADGGSKGHPGQLRLYGASAPCLLQCTASACNHVPETGTPSAGLLLGRLLQAVCLEAEANAWGAVCDGRSCPAGADSRGRAARCRPGMAPAPPIPRSQALHRPPGAHSPALEAPLQARLTIWHPSVGLQRNAWRLRHRAGWAPGRAVPAHYQEQRQRQSASNGRQYGRSRSRAVAAQ